MALDRIEQGSKCLIVFDNSLALLLNKLFTDKSAWSYICMDVFDDYNKKIAKTRYNLPEYKTGFDVALANQFSY